MMRPNSSVLTAPQSSISTRATVWSPTRSVWGTTAIDSDFAPTRIISTAKEGRTAPPTRETAGILRTTPSLCGAMLMRAIPAAAFESEGRRQIGRVF